MTNTSQELTVSDLLAVMEVGVQLGSEIRIDHVLHSILESAGRLTDSPKGAILLRDDESQGLYFAAATGDSADDLLKNWGQGATERVPMKSKAGLVFTTGESLIENVLREDNSHFKGVDQYTRGRTESMICVPLSVIDPMSTIARRIGVIQAVNKRNALYTDRDRLILEQFAGFAAVAIRNAALFRQLMAHMGIAALEDPVQSAEQLSRPPRIERMTILFADMRGSTQFCQALGNPVELHRLLGEYLTMISSCVLKNKGVVNKFLGDGLLAFFRETAGAENAVLAAFGMVEGFQRMQETWNKEHSQDLSFLDIGIGVATGDVMIGTIDCGPVSDFTPIGTPVNLAASYQSQARSPLDEPKKKRVLIDQPTFSGASRVISQYDGPHSIQLRKPDQMHGMPHKQYHVISLKQPGERGLEEGAAGIRVFCCHASQDKERVRDVYRMLRKEGFDTWFDEESLVAGQDWHFEIRKAVRQTDAIIVFLSASSMKEGYLQRELRHALDVADEKPEGNIFLIPAKLEHCSVPDRLSSLQCVDLTRSDDPKGFESLLRALRMRAQQLKAARRVHD